MPTAEATAAAAIIIREAAYAVGGETRPLPLLGSFNVTETTGWDPTYQMTLLEAGHKILPWLDWPDDIDVEDPEALAAFDDYYETYMEYCAELGLPLWFRGTQWEGMLIDDAATYETGDPETSAYVINPSSELWTRSGAYGLNPFGLLSHWDDPAAEYLDRDSWRRLQAFYPSPPLVIFHSNNETTKIRWHELETGSKHYVDTYGTEQTDEFKKALLATQWTERYQRMIATMRTTLESDSEDWADVAQFVAYEGFGPHEFGRYSGWENYDIVTDDAITPNFAIWDGGTYDYYCNYWEAGANTLTDYSCYSNQVEACNYPFQEAEAKAEKPGYLCELALWNGDGSSTVKWWPARGYAEEYEAHSKTCQYYALGQTYDLDRYQGWAQFGLWLTRPFVLREFRWSLDEKDNWPGYFDRLANIVDGVHASATKTAFWRNGTLVENEDYDHPYQSAIPSQYADVARSFLLTTSSDPERPWALDDTVPVFALAYVVGDESERSWLLYAHAPLGAVDDCTITIPGYGDVTVNVPRAGAFWEYSEMPYRFTARSTTPGNYRFTSGVLAQLVSSGDIRKDIDRGDGVEGTLVVPKVSQVEEDVQYGEDGTEYTGEFVGGTFLNISTETTLIESE